MSAYTSAQPPYRRLGSTDRYVLGTDLTWDVGREDSGLVVSVPAGSTFDLSIPLAIRWAFSPHDDRFLKAAALHDHLLEDAWDRATAGAVFSDALRASGVPAVQRFLMWQAVSLWRWR